MNIHEYQAKALLRQYGAPVSDGRIVMKADEAKTAASEMDGPLWVGVPLGLLVALAATVGDFAESALKRDLGIKDMGTLLPGHGGIMDRLDSLLPSAFVVWVVLTALL